MRHEIFMVVKMHAVVFWFVTPCGDGHAACIFRMKLGAATSLHGVTTQKTMIYYDSERNNENN
jgi:hypothetical protein